MKKALRCGMFLLSPEDTPWGVRLWLHLKATGEGGGVLIGVYENEESALRAGPDDAARRLMQSASLALERRPFDPGAEAKAGLSFDEYGEAKDAGLCSSLPTQEVTLDPLPDVVYLAAPEDEEQRKTLAKYLRPLLRQRKLVDWHVGDRPPGADPAAALRKAVSVARVVLLLVSPDYLVNPLRNEAEAEAIERSRAGGLLVCPVHVRAIDPYHYSKGWCGAAWDAQPFGHLAIIPSNNNRAPVMGRRDRDVAWTEVAAALRGLLGRLPPRAQVAKI